MVLEKAPLSSCEFEPGWNNSGWLADSIVIYPNRTKQNCFDLQRDQFLEQKKMKQQPKKQTKDKDDLLDKGLDFDALNKQEAKADNSNPDQVYMDGMDQL
mmetsp:Transcript_15752/g.24244  ORF Transcript_15752/g.24244 Transcript_15752/m.24244 type:complete len:100 (+) Transcript_15752:231-530(+)